MVAALVPVLLLVASADASAPLHRVGCQRPPDGSGDLEPRVCVFEGPIGSQRDCEEVPVAVRPALSRLFVRRCATVEGGPGALQVGLRGARARTRERFVAFPAEVFDPVKIILSPELTRLAVNFSSEGSAPINRTTLVSLAPLRVEAWPENAEVLALGEAEVTVAWEGAVPGKTPPRLPLGRIAAVTRLQLALPLTFPVVPLRVDEAGFWCAHPDVCGGLPSQRPIVTRDWVPR